MNIVQPAFAVTSGARQATAGAALQEPSCAITCLKFTVDVRSVRLRLELREVWNFLFFKVGFGLLKDMGKMRR